VKQAEGRGWYQTNRDDVLVRSQAARDTPEGREANRLRAAAYRAVATPEQRAKTLAANRKYKRGQYGIVNPTSETKSGKCYRAGCDYDGPLHFDHWHDGPLKGHFRGWLCPRCNKGAGMFDDSAAALRAMADYIDLAAGVGWPK
jgi:hypothetical protein